MTSLSDDAVGSGPDDRLRSVDVGDQLPAPTAPRQWLDPYDATRYARLIQEKNPEWRVWKCCMTADKWALYVQMSRERVTEGVWVFTARQAEEFLT